MQELLVDFITFIGRLRGRGGLARMVGTRRTRVSPPSGGLRSGRGPTRPSGLLAGRDLMRAAPPSRDRRRPPEEAVEVQAPPGAGSSGDAAIRERGSASARSAGQASRTGRP
jgi:hypothetical protein